MLVAYSFTYTIVSVNNYHYTVRLNAHTIITNDVIESIACMQIH